MRRRSEVLPMPPLSERKYSDISVGLTSAEAGSRRVSESILYSPCTTYHFSSGGGLTSSSVSAIPGRTVGLSTFARVNSIDQTPSGRASKLKATSLHRGSTSHGISPRELFHSSQPSQGSMAYPFVSKIQGSPIYGTSSWTGVSTARSVTPTPVLSASPLMATRTASRTGRTSVGVTHSIPKVIPRPVVTSEFKSDLGGAYCRNRKLSEISFSEMESLPSPPRRLSEVSLGFPMSSLLASNASASAGPIFQDSISMEYEAPRSTAGLSASNSDSTGNQDCAATDVVETSLQLSKKTPQSMYRWVIRSGMGWFEWPDDPDEYAEKKCYFVLSGAKGNRITQVIRNVARETLQSLVDDIKDVQFMCQTDVADGACSVLLNSFIKTSLAFNLFCVQVTPALIQARDYYTPSCPARATLGLEPFAPWKEIQKSYRRLVIKCHPDKVGNAHMKEFLEIQEAFEQLSRDPSPPPEPSKLCAAAKEISALLASKNPSKYLKGSESIVLPWSLVLSNMREEGKELLKIKLTMEWSRQYYVVQFHEHENVFLLVIPEYQRLLLKDLLTPDSGGFVLSAFALNDENEDEEVLRCVLPAGGVGSRSAAIVETHLAIFDQVDEKNLHCTREEIVSSRHPMGLRFIVDESATMSLYVTMDADQKLFVVEICQKSFYVETYAGDVMTKRAKPTRRRYHLIFDLSKQELIRQIVGKNSGGGCSLSVYSSKNDGSSLTWTWPNGCMWQEENKHRESIASKFDAYVALCFEQLRKEKDDDKEEDNHDNHDDAKSQVNVKSC